MLNSVQLAQDTGVLKRPLRLLIIDDDPIDRQSYLRILRNDDANAYIVVEAATAEEGLRALSDGPYDCIILDYLLPGADGIEMLRSVRDTDGAKMVAPVVMMTGKGSEGVAVRAMKLGIADYLTKEDMTPLAFRRAIRNAIEKSSLRIALLERSRHLEVVNAELKKHDAELQGFYHTVSHELKTPLAAVREFVALVRDGVTGELTSPQQKEYLQRAIEGCDQIARQVNELLDAARSDTHKLELNPKAVPVEQAVSFAVAAVRKEAEAKGIVIEIAIAAALPPVLADRDRLTQILGNLLNNGVKFTQPGGRVGITARCNAQEPSQVEISVSDSGCGIAPMHLERIFDRLFQAPQAADFVVNGGLGLGLSIARDLVQRHGGRLTVESTLGEGSTFTFHLPAAPADSDVNNPAIAA